MIRKTIWAVALFVTLASARAQTVSATANYTIEDGSPGYTYSDTGTYFNFGVILDRTNMTTYKSFAVIDFPTTAFGGVLAVIGGSVSMEESCYASTSPTTLTIWSVPDNTVNLHTGQTNATYDDGVLGGYDGQLGTPTMLATFDFTSNSTGNSEGNINQIDTFTIPPSAYSAIASAINSPGQVVRILITTNETGYATYFGAGGGSSFKPQLKLAVVPSGKNINKNPIKGPNPTN